MKYLQIEQLSPEWWAHKVGKISGTRFGQVVSGRANTLIEELADEILNGECEISDYESEDMIFGRENEEIALNLYGQMSGINFTHGGVMQSEENENHIASPDGYIAGKAAEVKSTRHGYKHLARYTKGLDAEYKMQGVNYFAVDPKLEEVHFVFYCPFRPERPIIPIVITRDTIIRKGETVQDVVIQGLHEIPKIKAKVNSLISEFINIKF
jgi:predicted Zn-dependent protease with MMP-like domain